MRRSKSVPGLTRRDFLGLGVAAGAWGLLQGSTPAAQAAAAPKRGGTITTAQTDTFYTFDPYKRNWYRVRRTVYNSLAHYDRNLTLQPELAEKWDLAPDGKSITFKLRQGVKYHSGREFTSEDMKFSLEYAASDELVLQRPMYQMVKKIETPDRYTLTLRMDAPNAGIFDLIDAAHAIDKETIADSAKTANGTGPFKLDKYLPNDRIEFVAFKDYWDKGKPYMDRYIARIIPDPSALAMNLESGAVDAVWRISYLDAVRLKDSGGKFVVDMGPPGVNIFDVGLNCKLAPFNNKKVRQAIGWAIDRARFSKTVTQSLSDPTCLVWPPQSWAYFKDLQGKIGYDLDKARALLKEAGYEKGFDAEILTSSKRGFGYGDLAVMLQADLRKIGINAKVSDVEVAQYDARTQKGDIQILAHMYGRANLDPITTLTAAKAWYTEREKGWTHFESEEYDGLRRQLGATLAKDNRIPLARKIQELLLDECPTLPVAEAPQPWVLGSYIKNFAYDMDNNPYLDEIWLEK
jgi:peptide/nickel transport system substrate-binding protein